MTEQTRRNVFRYGIAIDLVILAAGVGLLFPASAGLLLGTFAVATALSVWRGGWQGGLLAGFLSLAALALIFPEVIRPVHLATFIALGAAGSVAVAMATRQRTIAPAFQPAAIAAAAAPIAVPNPAPMPQPQVAPAQRSALADVVLLRQNDEQEAPTPLEPVRNHKKNGKKRKQDEERVRREAEARQRADADRELRERQARLAKEREEAQRAAAAAEEERKRIARELEAQLAREREEAQRIEAERVAAEEARLRAEEERARIARELEEQLAREREEAQRAEAARIAAEEERARIARELEEQLAREREEAQRREAERVAAEEERQRLAKELEEQRAREREEAMRLEAERREADEARARAEEERQRVAKELEERVAREREEARREQERLESERRAADEARAAAEAERERIAKELEELVARAASQVEQAGAGVRDAEEVRLRAEAELQERLAQERQATERDLHERLEAERRAAEEDLRRQLESEREAMRAQAGQEFATERARIEKEASERVAEAQRAAEAATANVRTSRPSKTAPDSRPSFLGTISGWFKREPASGSHVNLSTKRLPVNGNTTATKRPAQPSSSAASPVRRSSVSQGAPAKPRLLFIERRRGTAEPVIAKLRQRNIDVEVVERWVDAVDEIFRFRPSALLLDIEHPEFEKIHKTLSDKTSQLPVVLTGRSVAVVPPTMRYAAFVNRPYDSDDIARIAQVAFARPEDLLLEQSIPREMTKPLAQQHHTAGQRPAPASRPVAAPAPPAAPSQKAAQPAATAPLPAPPTNVVPIRPAAVAASAPNGNYEVTCYSCRVPYDAVDADWCSCLAKERSLVCTNCLSCFCKAPPAYKEKFWVEAPPRLFERKTVEGRRQDGALRVNPPKDQVTRPLVLAVEDDEEIQAIVQRVCSNLGYGFIWANNGQDGLDIAREYKPNMILSDAFMPKLDGREMCRILKEEPLGADMRMVVMTGLYTDTKYRSEAVKRFHVDDYIAKPVSITDLINLLQKHLEGVTGLPQQEDLHELHRKDIDDGDGIMLDDGTMDGDVPLSDILTPAAPKAPRSRNDSYDVSCYNCQLTFDATHAEWCSCVGRDNTLVCEHCHGCFCKAPAAYRERFWIDAPPSLFERKMIGSKRALSAGTNPLPADVKRPLILLVEDDENVQLIVRTVVSSMGYGFVVGANGQEGLSLAREYNPDLILSDAFMPKLDGREMCRLLKEDPMTARAKAIIMTGLYTDRKYRNEALDYFKVDDYVAKPLAVDDLIKLFKKHLPQEVSAAN
ncbi:MAG TPA: response regulator [Thermoanaerobaculia bacterium]|nr:response regulator [Thermoanaerobaculia bacterium]